MEEIIDAEANVERACSVKKLCYMGENFVAYLASFHKKTGAWVGM